MAGGVLAGWHTHRARKRGGAEARHLIGEARNILRKKGERILEVKSLMGEARGPRGSYGRGAAGQYL